MRFQKILLISLLAMLSSRMLWSCSERSLCKMGGGVILFILGTDKTIGSNRDHHTNRGDHTQLANDKTNTSLIICPKQSHQQKTFLSPSPLRSNIQPTKCLPPLTIQQFHEQSRSVSNLSSSGLQYRGNNESIHHVQDSHKMVSVRGCSQVDSKNTQGVLVGDKGYRGNMNVNMRTLERSHRPIVPSYICSVCSSMYITRKGLDDHKKMHQSVKRYRCLAPKCSKLFSRKFSRTKHERKWHPHLLPYQCACGDAFETVKSLRIHKKRQKHR